MKSEFYTITNKLNIYIENKCIKSSAEIIEDITFAQSLNGLIVASAVPVVAPVAPVSEV